MSVVGKSPVKQGKVLVWYHNPCTEKTGSSMESEVPSDRSIKKPRYSDKDSYSSVSEWASLPRDIFILILDKVYELIDHIRLGAACKHWKNVSIEHNRTNKRWRKVLPMLMIPFSSRTKRMVCSISEGKIYTNVQLPVPYDKRCSGSSHGWLATAAENFAITLLNPFRKAVAIHLPPLTFSPPPCFKVLEKKQIELKKQCEYYVHKVILSADPSLNPDNYMVVAIYDLGCRLAFIKAGQRDWTYISETCMFSDATFHRGQIYAVGQGGKFVSFDVNSSNDVSRPPKANLLTPLKPILHPRFPPKADKAYLVISSSGDLFHVRRFLKRREGLEGINSFVVYKVFFNDNDGTVVKQDVVESIGDDALFLGDNHSISISASKFPGCQPNSIYFTNDIWNGGMGLFKLEDKSVTGLYPLNPTPPAIWIVPPFKDIR